MAIGFPASHKDQYTAPLPVADLHAYALHAVHELGWKIDKVQPGSIIARTALNFLTYGETIQITLAAPDRLEIHSKCTFPLQYFDWGKNRQNAINFLNTIEKVVYQSQNPMASPPPPMKYS